MRLGYCTITWGGVVGHPVGVTSVKDLFYLANGSMADAVADIASAGYEGVEMFDGNLVAYADQPQTLTELLAANGVELVSVYTGANFIYDDLLADELHRIRRAAELAARFGAGRLVVGGGATRADGIRDSDYDALGAALDQVTEIADGYGLEASYHPHLSTIVEGPEQLEKLMGKTRIGFCPDTAHLAAGGGDPAALIRRYPERLRHVHLKDLLVESNAFRPLGAGNLDIRDIVAALRETGYDSWLMVELDEYDGAPVDAARASKAFLDHLLAG